MRLISRGVAAVGFAASCALFIAALVIAGFGAFSSGSDNVDAAAPLATVGEEKPSPTAVAIPAETVPDVPTLGEEEPSSTAVAIPAETVPGVPTLGDDDQDEGSAEGDPTLDGLPAEPPEQGLSNDVRPVRVKIPAIDVDANVIDLGLNPDRTLEVPTDYAETGWYTGRSVPGAVGPSVVVGHLDSFSGPAVFYRLQDLVPGHIVEIHRSDDVVARFRVTGTKLVDKDEFPTAEVYGPTEAPTLRLITCDGAFDESARSYEGNLLVFAEHIENINAWKPSRLTGRR